jgi:hypothetical protein
LPIIVMSLEEDSELQRRTQMALIYLPFGLGRPWAEDLASAILGF